MKKILHSLCTLLAAGGWLGLTGCEEPEEAYPAAPREIYIVNRVAAGTVNFTNAAAAGESVARGVARVYLNQPSDQDVQVSFTLAGTATAGTDYEPPAANLVTVPAGSWYGEITFSVLNDTAKEPSETVVISLTGAPEGFQLGLGDAATYKTFTYTIQDND